MHKKFLTHYLPYVILVLGLGLGLFRLWYFVHADIPLGYDPGMYKEIFSHYWKVITSFDFSLLPRWVRHEPLLGILAAFVNKLGISFDWLVTWGIGVVNLVPGLLLFWYFRAKGQSSRWGVFAAILYWTSVTQYDVFWWNYFKQTLGVSVLLILLILGEKGKLWLQSLIFFLLVILHKHTALYVGAILALEVLIESIFSKKLPWKKILFWVVAGGLALVVYIPLWKRIITEAVSVASMGNQGGDFSTLGDYLRYSWPVLLLSLSGVVRRIKEFGSVRLDKKFDVRLLGYVVGVIWIGFSLVNYNRTLVFFDVFAIIFAAYFLWKLCQKYLILGVSLSVLALVGLGGNYLKYVDVHAQPLISQDEFDSIKSLHTLLEPNAIVINSHRNYSPWMMGRSQRDYINPGMADLDVWNQKLRIQRRSIDGKGKCEMLKSSYAHLERPMYLWLGIQQFPENLDGGDCFVLIRRGTTRNLYRIGFR